MGAHAEWFDTQFVSVVGPGWATVDTAEPVTDHALVIGFDNYAVVTGSLDQLDNFAAGIRQQIANCREAEREAQRTTVTTLELLASRLADQAGADITYLDLPADEAAVLRALCEKAIAERQED